MDQAVRSALRYIEREGIDTYDPLDLSTHAISHRLLAVRTRSGGWIRRVLWAAAYIAPRKGRVWLGIEKKATAGGVANLASMYVELGEEENLAKSRQWLEWLKKNATITPTYTGWGFPFSWKQRLLVLSGTPIGHTTMTCGNAFLKYHRATGEQWALDWVRSSCELFLNGLNRTERPSGSVALSYTPLDQMQIINIQADIGSLLCRTYAETGDERYKDLGLKLIRCVLETQNNDGSWCYYTPDSIGGPSFIDNHHTAMCLSGLSEVYEVEGLLSDQFAAQVRKAVEKGTEYFIRELFTAEGLPKYYNSSVYPLETYNYAQAIITSMDVLPVFAEDRKLGSVVSELLEKLVRGLIELMQTRDGSFLFRRTRFLKQDLGSLRWANALATASLVRWKKEQTQSRANVREGAVLQNH